MLEVSNVDRMGRESVSFSSDADRTVGGGPRQSPYDESKWAELLKKFHANQQYAIDYTTYAFAPAWKPIGFDSTADSGSFLKSTGVDDTHFGIPGAGGRLFAFL